MEIITVRFTTKWPNHIGSLAVARLSGSRNFSHCMSIVDGKAYEAVMFGGCRDVDVADAMRDVVAYQDMYVPVPNIDAAVGWAKSQHRKPYDFLGAFGIPLLMSEDWGDESSWWCSELAFRMIWKGGTIMLDPSFHSRVTPEHLRMCNYKKSPIYRLK